MTNDERGRVGDEEVLNTKAFLEVANRFIEFANRENMTVKATDLHMAFLYGAARYNAYVAKAILEVENHEEFVDHMVEQYRKMLQQHLADGSLEEPVD
ncbi:DUF3144 domain-containing protein [Microbaculum marinum]|uniref:DUF3144 domain-containing protein n=1 Tax=Microbaculum marinum TaxID=1764581 RepID=A0AAW9RZA9_9HYPH